MEVRYSTHPGDARLYDTEELREKYLLEKLFEVGKSKITYCFDDRMIAGGICPVEPLQLPSGSEVAADYFLQRREIGIINIGPAGTVVADGVEYHLDTTDGLYIGRSTQQVLFLSDNPTLPAKFYFNSCPAHRDYPTIKILQAQIEPKELGDQKQSNVRKLYKYIHPEGVRSCQLVMGLTALAEGNMWNSMPCHTHDRRMEVYLYFNLQPEAMVFHFMGEPEETRHVVMRNEDAIISPSWSIHCGVGTSNYTFIWGMAGENQRFDDMDPVVLQQMK